MPESDTGLRIAGTRTTAVTIWVNGKPVEAFPGETVATALLAHGHRILRRSPRSRRPRGVFCAMGICQECVLDVDGRLRTSCTTPVREGMHVVTGVQNA